MAYLCLDGITIILENHIIKDLEPSSNENDKKKFYLKIVSKIISKLLKSTS